jgi:hypothetical protein
MGHGTHDEEAGHFISAHDPMVEAAVRTYHPGEPVSNAKRLRMRAALEAAFNWEHDAMVERGEIERELELAD